LSIYVRELGAEQSLLEFNADVPRNPASTQKLLTTFAALELLGPAHTWHTDVYALGTRSGDRLDGDLLVKGYGDPSLTTERVWLLLHGVMRKGIKQVSGDLVLDDSYFAGTEPRRIRRPAIPHLQRASHALLRTSTPSISSFERTAVQAASSSGPTRCCRT
jgi:D-alanyl-D-alanine carboxypeptidase